MGTLSMRCLMKSEWIKNRETGIKKLNQDLECDVLIVGAGMSGFYVLISSRIYLNISLSLKVMKLPVVPVAEILVSLLVSTVLIIRKYSRFMEKKKHVFIIKKMKEQFMN